MTAVTTHATRYLVIDAPGHHGDWIKVYRVSQSLHAARKFIGGSPLFAVVRDSGSHAKGDRISRAASLSYVR